MRNRLLGMLDVDGNLFDTYLNIAWWRSGRPGAVSYLPFDPWAHPDPSLSPVWGEDVRTEEPIWFKESFLKMKPIPGMQALVSRLSEDIDFAALTSSYQERRADKAELVTRNFPEVKDVIYFGDRDEPQTKGEVCRERGASFIMEDRYDYALDCAESGIWAIVFDRYPWSLGDPHPLISHVKTPQEAETLIRARLLS